MTPRILVLGAGFGGLELTTLLSNTFGDALDLTLIDRSDAFVFGFSKLEVMFGRESVTSVRAPYAQIAKPGVTLRRETVTAIDPRTKQVTTDRGRYEADILVVALGADYDIPATPGLAEGGHEFYSVAGAERLRAVIPTFTSGHAVVGVCGKSFKCPPAPSEAALLLHDYLEARGLRATTTISLVMPFGVPIPPSPDTSKALLAAFAERDIRFIKDSLVERVDGERRVVLLKDGRELPCDLFLGVPVHRVPPVVVESGLSAHPHDWVPVDKGTLETAFPGVFAIGDVNGVGTAKAGVFAEGAARVVAASITARIQQGPAPARYTGQGICYIEFGHNQVAKVDVDFLSGPKPSGTFHGVSEAILAEKRTFRSVRLERWFGAL
jgi:sulfide:quinone oxidoreductase